MQKHSRIDNFITTLHNNTTCVIIFSWKCSLVKQYVEENDIQIIKAYSKITCKTGENI